MNNRIIEIPEYTIIMTIGPSNCGKSYFCDNLLMPFLKKINVHAKYFSSDATRRDLLGADLHKHDFNMMAASKSAFNLLHTNLKEYTSYPINTPVVVINATNLSKTGRSFIVKIAEENNYNLVGLFFDYKDVDDYTKYVDENIDKRIIFNMVKDLKKNVEKEIDKTKFKAFYKINSIDFSDIEFKYTKNTAGTTINHDNICVVADLHGCYDEFLEMLQDDKGLSIDFNQEDGIPKLNFVKAAIDANKYIHHVLVGDIVDKGIPENVEKLVRFLHKNRDYFTIVEGNHDRWNYNVLKGKIKIGENEQFLIDSFFNSVTLFQNNEELKNVFFELYESMFTFASNNRMIVTHAPCKNKYLGKADKVSLKQMNTIRYPKSADYENNEAYLDAKEEYFQFLIDDGDGNFPLHFFGHVDLKSVFQNKNKYGIDTGCVAGNTLSTAILMKENRKPFIKKYKSKQPVTKELSTLFRTKLNKIEFGALDFDVQKRLKWLAKNKVNFVSGTMSPCDKDFENGELESLSKGLEYFKSKGINKVILQPKFMGSRANYYMSNVGENTIISRNGYTIDAKRLKMSDEDYNKFLVYTRGKFDYLFTDGVEMIIFDGELLPWNVMGRELIERDFKLASKACTSEIDILVETGFEKMFSELLNKNTSLDITKANSQEKTAKKIMDEFSTEMLDIHTTKIALDKYNHQISLFGSDAEIEFKPFSILKYIYKDGSEKNMISADVSNIAMFESLGSDGFVTLDLNDDDYLSQAEFFWNNITNVREMEGLVIKPEVTYQVGVAPYMKCRNKEYLRLTYGFDYDYLNVKTEKLMKNKSIKRKLETSVKEYELGRMALNIKRSEISIDNAEWLSIMVQLINEQNSESFLDPRL